jgi:hypothetical protein
MPQPKVPDWIRKHVPPTGWTNVFSLVPSNERLYGTETLFGDWDGKTLLLAKDGAPTEVIRALRDKGDPQPWRHAQRERGDAGGYKTNESLAAAAARLPGGKLYGSATANLLCDDPGWSRSLPGFYSGPLHDYLKRVLTWVIETMPNLERIACLGRESWFLTSVTLGRPELSQEFASYRTSCQPMVGLCGRKKISAFALFHPAARVSDSAKLACWAPLMGVAPPALARSIPSPRRHSERQFQMPHRNSPSAGSTDSPAWSDIPPSPNADRVTPVGIGRDMLEILKAANVEQGVPSKRFASLKWKDDEFREDKLQKAMKFLASNTGRTLQHRTVRVGQADLVFWRIKP